MAQDDQPDAFGGECESSGDEDLLTCARRFDAAEEAEKQSKTYEEWAIGVLDLVEPPEVAMGLLTLVATRSRFHRPPVSLRRDPSLARFCDGSGVRTTTTASRAWPSSRDLIRSTCLTGTTMVTTWSGCKIDPKSEQSRLIAQILLMLFHGMTLGCFVNILP